MKKTNGRNVILCLLILVLCSMALSALAEDEAVDALVCGNFKYILMEDGTAEIVGWTGKDSCVVIPAKLNGHAVTSIGEEAFANSDLQEAVLPDTVVHLSAGAFYGCALTSLTIPPSVAVMDGNPFAMCFQLKELTLSEENPFFEWVGDALVSKAEGTLIYYPFWKDTEEVRVPEGIRKIGARAFMNCSMIQKLNLPRGLEEIGDDALNGCARLSEISGLDDLETIGSRAFANCYELPALTLPGSVRTIGDRAFDYCWELSEITLNTGLECIGDEAFTDCWKLKEIRITSSVQSIGVNPFTGCTSLKTISVDYGNPFFELEDKMLVSKEEMRLICCVGARYGSRCAVPDGIRVIGERAFDHSSIGEIVMPESLERIEDSAFYNCSRLEDIYWPKQLLSLGESCFSNCDRLERIALPEGLVSTGKAVFSGCNELSAVWIPEGVETVGASAFSDCTKLSRITFPETLRTIEEKAFARCESLRGLEIPAQVRSIGASAFSGCRWMGTLTLPSALEELGDRACADCTGLQEIQLPSSLLTVGHNPFIGCTSLRAIRIETGERFLSVDGVLLSLGEEPVLIAYPCGIQRLYSPRGHRAAGEYSQNFG